MTGKKVDISKIDLEREKEKITDIPGLLSFAHNVGSALIKPEDQGKIKGLAMTAMYEQTDNQYQQVFDQMKVLLEQANEIKTRVDLSERIYKAEMSFQPVIHQLYYLYQKENGNDFLSLIGPNEWGKSKTKLSYLGTVKLLADHTWEVIESGAESFN